MLAPSPAHATTAAILRSGWSAFGGDAESAGLAVDLSVGPHPARALARSTACATARTSAGCSARASSAACTRPGSTHDRASCAAGARRRREPGAADGDRRRAAARPRARLRAAPTDEHDGYSAPRRATGRAARRRDRRRQKAAAARPCSTTAPPTSTPSPTPSVAQSVFSLTEGNVPEATRHAVGGGHRRGRVPAAALRRRRRARRATITHRLALLLDPAATRRLVAGRDPAVARWRRPALEAWLAGAARRPGELRLRRCSFADPATGAPPRRSSRARWPTSGSRRSTRLPRARRASRPGSGASARCSRAWAEGAAEASPTRRRRARDGAASVARRSRGRRAGAARAASPRRATSTAATSPRRARPTRSAGIDTAELAAASATCGRARGRRAGARRGAARPRTGARPRGRARRRWSRCAGFQLSGRVPRGAADARRAARRCWPRSTRGLDAASPTSELAGSTTRPHRALSERCSCRARARRSRRAFTAANGAALDASFARPRLGSRDGADRVAGGRRARGPGRAAPARRRSTRSRRCSTASASASRSPSCPTIRGEGWAAIEPADRGRARAGCACSPPARRRRFGAGAAAGLVLGAWTEADPARRARTAGARRALRRAVARGRRRRSCCARAEDGDGFSFERGARHCSTRRSTLAQAADGRPARRSSELGQYLPAATYLGDDEPGGRRGMSWQRLESGDRRHRAARGPGGAHRRPAVAARPPVAGGGVHRRGRREPDRSSRRPSSTRRSRGCGSARREAAGRWSSAARRRARSRRGRARAGAHAARRAVRLAAEAGLQLWRCLAAAARARRRSCRAIREAFPLKLGADDGLDPVGRAELALLARRVVRRARASTTTTRCAPARSSRRCPADA